MKYFCPAALFISLFLIGNTCFSADKPEKVKLLHHLTNQVIKEDTTWSGQIEIEGIVVVKKGARLTIAPGTTVRFAKIDVDKDGIGDCELIVEGSLIAKGSKEKPITFTSKAASPQKRDWKFIMVNFSAGTHLEYCIIEYAFSAIQVHFSDAVIRNSILRNCEDGLRFSTAKLILENNQISDNVYGIRYEERGSKATVRFNNITDNDYGVFCVLKSEGLSQISENNIYNNRKYNLLMGEKQQADIALSNNYWGADNLEKAREKIFDKIYDSNLGAARIAPIRQTPISAAGIK